MKIYHAQVNHLENPVGFRMETDGLFLESERREKENNRAMRESV